MNRRFSALFESFDRRRETASFLFADLEDDIVAHTPEEVLPALRRVEAAVARGRHAAGFIAYEAAPGLDPSLPGRPRGDLRLVRFGIFRHRRAIPAGHFAMAAATGYRTGDWRPSWTEAEHASAVARIREYIAAGDTYQVNLTFRQQFAFAGDPFGFYRDLCRSQLAPFCAWLDLGNRAILSASPELFFRLADGTITVRPMKGTARRGRWRAEDDEARRLLRDDPKERAENLMIVDLLRNDLGKVAETGSIEVTSLFDVETLPSIHQMTSTITARLRHDTGVADVIAALFPCGSITGAPKRRAMEIAAELEDAPRGVYTGCIGYISPGSEAVFSVAIRTALIDREQGTGELGVGSGIIWDSRADAEYAECLAKGRFALAGQPEFQLVETMLYQEGGGYFLLSRHLNRLKHAAAYYGFAFNAVPVVDTLARRAAPLAGSHKVRLLLDREGSFTIATEPLPPVAEDAVCPVTFARGHVDSADPFLFHKTTHRPLYLEELESRPDCADVIFLNERGEVTEGANNNIVARIGDALVTPPLVSGLLPGVFREELLEQGEIIERVLTREDLERAEEVWLINSVRKWRRARLV
jgi:para-aminobenzoate synthetase / 4-amino-4-deoxychorismate lyase